MKFIDEATITVQSGKGGDGCLSFRRERHVPRGGPDGGDGGKGGDVILRSTTRKRTLYDFHFKRLFKGENGKPGQGSQKTGRNGADTVIEIPAGTLVRDADSRTILKDFTTDEDAWVAARGGRGGKGNRHFATSTHRTPRFSQPGEAGESRKLHLELKLLADVGLVGLPNAGKSTLIRAMTAANAKVGAYPFTTLTPQLGVVHPQRGEPFVMADIPGLIEGAHTGAGLGIQFLRHIERTRLILHLIDAAEIDPDQPLAGLEAINRELAQYSGDLAAKPQMVVLNKMDIESAPANAERFAEAAADLFHFRISAAGGVGIEPLREGIFQRLEKLT